MWNQDQYIAALNFAAAAHGEQKIPGKPYPYVVHVTEVAQEVMAAAALAELQGCPFDADLAVQCALLHDTVEDAGMDFETLRKVFGQAVAEGVLALTKSFSLPKEKQMEDSLRRILLQPREVWRVKLCDRIINLQPAPDYWDRAKKTAYREEAKLILQTLGEADAFLAKRLQEKIDHYDMD